MKKIWKYMIVALAGLSLLACNKEKDLPEEEIPSVDKYTYTIAITGDTRAHFNDDHMTWDEGDLIGWFINDEAPDCSEINYNENPRSFDVTSSNALPANSTVYAYAPFYTFYFDDNPTKTAAPLSIPVNQDGLIYDAMPMVSLPIVIADAKEAKANTPVAEASFINLGAVIEYNVYTTTSSYNAEKIESISFASDSNIAGDFTVDLTSVSASSIPAPSGLTRNTITSTLSAATTVGGSKTEGVKVYQVVAPGTWSGTITVTTDAAVYEYKITSKEFNRAKIRTLNVDLGSENAVRTDNSSYESLLTGTTWKISAFGEYYDDKYPMDTGSSLYADDAITFNADHTITYSIQNGIFYWDNSATEGYAFTPSGSESWTLEEKPDGLYLMLSGGGIPLMMVSETDAVNGSFKILSLTESALSLYMVITEWDNYQTYVDFAPAGAFDHSAEEALLTGTTWKISDFGEYYGERYSEGTGTSLYADDAITFNADHTITYSIQNGIFYWDNSATEGYAFTPSGSESWTLEEKSDGLYLTLSGGGIPLMMVSETDAVNGSFKILSLTESELSLFMVITEWDSYQTFVDFAPASGTPM